ncbi:MAG: hypothetical protein P8020_17365 [Acidobacteriota bacterium]
MSRENESSQEECPRLTPHTSEYFRDSSSRAGIKDLDETLTARHVPHVYRVYENGPHGWQLVVDHLEEVAKFLSQSFSGEAVAPSTTK